MSELTPKARALLEAARGNHGPNQDDRDRVLAGLHASLGIAGALPILTDASTASAGTSGPQLAQPPAAPAPVAPPVTPDVLVQPAVTKALGWSKLVGWKAGKVYLATLVLGGSAVGVSMAPRVDEDVHARRSAAMVAPSEQREAVAAAVVEAPVEEVRAAEAPVAEVPVAEVPVAEAPVVVAAAPQVEAAPVEVARVEPASVARVAVERRAAREVRVSKSTARLSARSMRVEARQETRRREREERELLARDNTPPEPKPSAPVEDVAAAVGVSGTPSPELTLIRAALTSLRDRDSLQALRLLDEHAARYPSGAFSTERRALHVVALCAAGRTDEGARERAQFLKTSGDSPIAARVRSACPR
ncbi:MAG: hypothetical protein ABW352_25465 [Polyangiales bacterium]